MYHLEHDVALGWVHLVERLPRDDDHRGHSHQRCRDPEGQGVAGCVTEALHILSENRRHDSADERAGIDAEVEHGEEGLQLALLFRKFELVSTKGGDTRLDATSANRDKSQSEKCHRPETTIINSKYGQVQRPEGILVTQRNILGCIFRNSSNKTGNSQKCIKCE